ncbi:P52 family lipoprotein [Borreliella bissettiae]|uniref:P52 family lipoprotein n=1 Tax=Borrelia bissettiae TaxID=64897 RepID=UPI001E5188E9|nr:P52 family lipoprotein [Borreliella bissettiae]MCD2401600.1 P52 family lipoprotein [Borreliella bissettiae]
MRADDIITEGKFSNLKLDASEHCLLDNIEKTIYNLKYGSYPEIPPLPDYNEGHFDKFFLDLGSERSRELIRLFGKVKNDHNNNFKIKCIFCIHAQKHFVIHLLSLIFLSFFLFLLLEVLVF